MVQVKKSIKSKKKIVRPIRKSTDVPITQGLLLATEKKLFSAISEIKFKNNSIDKKFFSIDKHLLSFTKQFESSNKRFDSIDKRFEAIDKRFDSIDKRFEAIDKRFGSIDRRFDAVDEKFEALEKKMDSRFNQISSEIQGLRTDMHQMLILMEEQNARNKIVLEGYEQLYLRQDRLESKVDERLSAMEKVVLNKSQV